MREVGIKELKAHASEIVRQVSENKARYVVSNRGKPVAVIVPVGSPETCERERKPTVDEVWDDLMRLGHEIQEHWTSDKSAVELLSEMRR